MEIPKLHSPKPRKLQSNNYYSLNTGSPFKLTNAGINNKVIPKREISSFNVKSINIEEENATNSENILTTINFEKELDEEIAEDCFKNELLSILRNDSIYFNSNININNDFNLSEHSTRVSDEDYNNTNILNFNNFNEDLRNSTPLVPSRSNNPFYKNFIIEKEN
jgi:hypothetical protein